MSSYANVPLKLDNTTSTGGGGGGGVDTASSTSFGTSATSAITVGSALRTLNLAGSSIVSSPTIFTGSTSTNAIVIRNSADTTNSSYSITTNPIGDLLLKYDGGLLSNGDGAGPMTLLGYDHNYMQLYIGMYDLPILANFRLGISNSGSFTPNATLDVDGDAVIGNSEFSYATFNIGQLTFNHLTTGFTPTAVIGSGGPAKCIGLPMVASYDLTSQTGAVTVSAAPVASFRLPLPWKILGVRATLYTPSTAGAVTINIVTVASGTTVAKLVGNGTSIFGTTLTIAASRQSSCEVGNTPYTLTSDPLDLADNSGVSIFVTSAGTGASGLKLIIYYSVS